MTARKSASFRLTKRAVPVRPFFVALNLWSSDAECAAVMTTTFETQVYNETIRREGKSKLSWSQQHAEDAPFAPRPVFPLNSQEHARLDKLKNKVADLCDLQPTPVSMLRPPRKVRSRAPLPHTPVARMVLGC